MKWLESLDATYTKVLVVLGVTCVLLVNVTGIYSNLEEPLYPILAYLLLYLSFWTLMIRKAKRVDILSNSIIEDHQLSFFDKHLKDLRYLENCIATSMPLIHTLKKVIVLDGVILYLLDKYITLYFGTEVTLDWETILNLCILMVIMFFFHFFLFLCVDFILICINYKNLYYPYLLIASTCIVSIILAYFAFFLFKTVSISGYVEPWVMFEYVVTFQKNNLGYSATTRFEIVNARLYQAFFLEQPPLLPGNILDIELIVKKLQSIGWVVDSNDCSEKRI